MSLLKISDLEGLTYEQLSGNTQFKQALFEVSNPVSGETSAEWSYKSQYVRMCDFQKWTSDSISSFSNAVTFSGGINLSGNLCCNADDTSNEFFAKMYFGDFFDLKSGRISAAANESITFRSPTFELQGSTGTKLAYLGNTAAGLCVDLNMNSNRIQNLPVPTIYGDAANKLYVDAVSSNIINNLPLSGNFGMFASCDYVVTNTVPTVAVMQQRVAQTGRQAFYFVVNTEG